MNGPRDEAAQGKRELGVVKWFDVAKGWGFAVPEDGSDDLFLHRNRCLCPADELGPGTPISYYGVQGTKGSMIADAVRLRSNGKPPLFKDD